MKFSHFSGLTAALLLATHVFAAAAGTGPVPVAVLASDGFEAVGRLEAEGLSWYVDRADSNAPVLDAMLEVESGGRTAKATFRAERGDYLVADAAWLQPLRQPGVHPLALTLIVGDDGDLLAGDLVVAPPAAAPATGRGRDLVLWVAVGAAALVRAFVVRRRRGGAA